jgi:hypothetical protein
MIAPGPGLSCRQATPARNGRQGNVRMMTVAWDADDASMRLRAQAAHILGQALTIETPGVRKKLLQQSFELLRQAQVAENRAARAKLDG